MKKEFLTPSLEISRFNTENIITTSGDIQSKSAMEIVQENVVGVHVGTVNVKDVDFSL